MKSPKPLIPIFIISIFLTTFAYIVDSDPPYPNFLHTILEFFIMVILIAGLISGVYILIMFIAGVFSGKKNMKNTN